MRRSSDRGQAEPLAALVAVLAVTAGLLAYAGTLDAALGNSPDRETTETTLDRMLDTLRTAGVVDPTELNASLERAPSGWQANATLRSGSNGWTAGPTPPETDTLEATARVSVRRGPMRIRPGRIRVVLWR